MLCIFFVIGLHAQQSQIKGARSWNVISSLIGKSITESKAILKKEGLPQSDKETDEDLKMDFYAFYRGGVVEDDKEDEPRFILACRKDKVVELQVTYFYLDDDDKDKKRKDVADMQKLLKANDFLYDKVEDKYVRLYQHSIRNLSAAIYFNYTDKLVSNWNLIIGEPKLVALAIKE